MKIAVVSDIHGNYEAFAAVLKDIQKHNVDRIVSLGDNIGYGADSDKVVRLLIRNNIISVLGNHELAVKDPRIRGWFKKEAQKALEIAIGSLSEAALGYIDTMGRFLDMNGCYFVHGFPPYSVRIYLSRAGDGRVKQALADLNRPVCFVGHTHRLGMVHHKGTGLKKAPLAKGRHLISGRLPCFVNAGSVGQPRDGSCRAQYVVLDTTGWELRVRTLPYDARTAAQKIKRAGIPHCYARILEGGPKH